MSAKKKSRVLLLCGGVGGAKLAHGFEQLADEVEVWALVNTGDDFEHLGLNISPDLDTVLYTLAGIANQELGWGIEGESWRTLERLAALGGDSWFRLGDLDIATHLFRTAALRRGETLTNVTRELASQLGVRSRILPATDDRLRTQVHTESAVLDFQTYFVREQCAPVVERLEYVGADSAAPAPELLTLLADQAKPFDAIIIAPSNPFLSIAPILAINGLAAQLRQASARILAVSPIVSGQAIKGPAAKLMAELNLEVSAAAWAMYLRDSYDDLIDEWILDTADASDAQKLQEKGFAVRTSNTIMTGAPERVALAKWLLADRA
ncbi:MAG: 2-phospho-L-lactate transferase [Congregibacter sp.]